MLEVNFTKMQGLGNDFVVIDTRNTPFIIDNKFIKNIADRRQGVGCDQVIILQNSLKADIKMIIYNADGSKAEVCGNATRCVAKYIMEETVKDKTSIEFNNFISNARKEESNYICDMGPASMNWQKIPLAKEMNCLELDFSKYNLNKPAAVNIGNPHVIFFEENIEEIDIQKIGPLIENDSLFPQKANVSFAKIINNHLIVARIWERGAGETGACGSAACAITYAASKRGYIDNQVYIKFKNGKLLIKMLKNGHLEMAGEAKKIFTGIYYYD